MDYNILTGNWAEQKKLLKKRIADLTGSQILFSDGKKEELLVKLEKKLGKTQDELKKIIGEI
jgi:uncharacterized protein YjbJ (UPF0337 family)